MVVLTFAIRHSHNNSAILRGWSDTRDPMHGQLDTCGPVPHFSHNSFLCSRLLPNTTCFLAVPREVPTSTCIIHYIICIQSSFNLHALDVIVNFVASCACNQPSYSFLLNARLSQLFLFSGSGLFVLGKFAGWLGLLSEFPSAIGRRAPCGGWTGGAPELIVYAPSSGIPSWNPFEWYPG